MIHKKVVPISFDKDVAEFMRKNKNNTGVPTSTEVNRAMRKHYKLGV